MFVSVPLAIIVFFVPPASLSRAAPSLCTWGTSVAWAVLGVMYTLYVALTYRCVLLRCVYV